ncbi:MAG: DUF3786 domain-containing protein [Firmicutes bacterium]|nr:DUF3786 domain-containing protein [Bacillota bacterium]
MALINLNPALEKAREDLSRGNPEQMAARARVDYDPGSASFTVPFMGARYTVTYPNGQVAGPGKNVDPAVQVLLLHYLTGASGIPPNGKLISYKELPGGDIYITPFTHRAISPLVKYFGGSPHKLAEAARKLGGQKAAVGDVSVTVPFFPLVPVTYVIWEGDDEFPPAGNVLFDATAGTHLATEDYAVLAGMGVFELKKAAGL